MSIQGKISEDERGYLPPDEAWRWLQEMVACGEAPDDLGNDVAKWAAWIDHKYTRLHRIACGTASFRLEGPATATGKFINQSGGHAFARVVISVTPIIESSEVVIDTSRCVVVSHHQPESSEKDIYLAGVAKGILGYATDNRLIGMAVSVLEIQVHPIDSSEFSFKVAAARAMHEVVVIAGKIAV